MRSAITSLIIASMVIGGLAGAVDAPERPAPPSGELWNELGPDERAALKQRFERFMRLPPEQQEQLRDRWLKFKQLSPEQRQAMRERWRSFRGMPHEHRELMKKLHGRWQKMPPERRERIRKRMQERFRKMSDAELADFFRNMNTWGALSDEERQAISKRYLEIRKQHRGQRGRRPEGKRRRGPDGENPQQPKPQEETPNQQ